MKAATDTPGMFPWQLRQPDRSVSGFRMAAATLSFIAGYQLYGEAVELFMFIHVEGQPISTWRRHWTTKASALDIAETMCADVEDYMDALNALPRPVEDLSFDDFLQHLHMSINNELH